MVVRSLVNLTIGLGGGEGGGGGGEDLFLFKLFTGGGGGGLVGTLGSLRFGFFMVMASISESDDDPLEDELELEALVTLCVSSSVSWLQHHLNISKRVRLYNVHFRIPSRL